MMAMIVKIRSLLLTIGPEIAKQ